MSDPAIDPWLATFPAEIQELANRLRALVLRVAPDSTERLYPGWQLIGYRVPVGRRKTVYLGFVAPKPSEVVLGFERGVFLPDPCSLLEGSGTQVRQIRFRPGAAWDEGPVAEMIAAAVQVSTAPRGARIGALLEE